MPLNCGVRQPSMNDRDMRGTKTLGLVITVLLLLQSGWAEHQEPLVNSRMEPTRRECPAIMPQ